MRGRAPWLVPILALALSRCAAFGASSSDATPAPPVDAGPPGADGAIDGGEDASEGAAPFSCAAPNALCDDFERDGPVLDTTRWGSELGTAMHAIAPRPGGPGRALEITTMGSQADPSQGQYFLVKSLSGPIHSVHCAFSYLLEATSQDTGAYPFGIRLSGGADGGTYDINLSMRPSQDQRPDYFSGTANVAFVPIGIGAWHRIEFEIPNLRIWDNSIELPVPPGTATVEGPFAAADLDFGLLNYVTVQGNWKAVIDDILCAAN